MARILSETGKDYAVPGSLCADACDGVPIRHEFGRRSHPLRLPCMQQAGRDPQCERLTEQGGFMAKIDPESEKHRLVMLYGAMSDEGLQQLGREPEQLTDWAFEALREEMKKRGLSWAGEDMPLPSQMEQQETVEDPGNRPVVLRRYRDMPQAFVEKSVLDDAAIECFLQDDNVVRMDWLWSNAMGGIKLLVREKDAEEALKLLSQSPPDEAENAAKEE